MKPSNNNHWGPTWGEMYLIVIIAGALGVLVGVALTMLVVAFL